VRQPIFHQIQKIKRQDNGSPSAHRYSFDENALKKSL
jgi:hypothetical protein